MGKTAAKKPTKSARAKALVEAVENSRLTANQAIEAETRSEYGQFMTPPPIAQLMAAMMRKTPTHVELLDPGAGVGSLTAATVAELCKRPKPPKQITATVFEIDAKMLPYLQDTLNKCQALCEDLGIKFTGQIKHEDFIEAYAGGGALFGSDIGSYNLVVMNPPYRKINSGTDTRRSLSRVGIETTNLYTAFIALAVRAIRDGGELITINPRSFCNGPYFKPFRDELLDSMALDRIHVFESRKQAFKGDDVLQENIILHATKSRSAPGQVTISATVGADDEITRAVPYERVVHPRDPGRFIHIVTDEEGEEIRNQLSHFTATLEELDIWVSTGRVVDFRAGEFLRAIPEAGTVPLIYPTHFQDGFLRWPVIGSKKPNAIVDSEESASLLVPEGIYVLTKRFSAKEERRRIVASVYDPEQVKAPRVGFENHLNYFHRKGKGLPRDVAIGLCVFLNTTLVDQFFRQFNGHTQVNATDLKSLRYPSLEQLRILANGLVDCLPAQADIDARLSRLIGRP